MLSAVEKDLSSLGGGDIFLLIQDRRNSNKKVFIHTHTHTQRLCSESQVRYFQNARRVQTSVQAVSLRKTEAPAGGRVWEVTTSALAVLRGSPSEGDSMTGSPAVSLPSSNTGQ